MPDDNGQHLALLVDDLDGTIAELRADGIEVSDPSPVGSGRRPSPMTRAATSWSCTRPA